MHKLLFSLLLLTIVATVTADPLSLSAVRSANFTGSGLSYLVVADKETASVFVDAGACRRDGGGTGSTGVYAGVSTLLRQISLGGRTRSGVGWFSPGNQWQIYAAYDVKF